MTERKIAMERQEMYQRWRILREEIPTIETARDLFEYVGDLLHAWREGAFEPQDVAEYLEGIRGVIEGNAGIIEGEKSVEPSWRYFAEVLFRAFGHS